MNAAFDKIAGFTSNTPLSRSVLRRDTGLYLISKIWLKASKGLRDWGYGTALYDYRLKGRHPVQLLGSPDDPAPGNATLGAAIFGGDMQHRDEHIKINENFWKSVASASIAFRKYAHSFHWLQDLAQTSDQKKAQEAAETITGWWLETGFQWHNETWQAETLARRLINWLSHAPLVLSSLDLVYRSKVLHALARQARHLSRTLKDAPAGLPQIYTCTGLTLAGLLLPGGEKWRMKGARLLEATVKAFILPDGGPASRNASDAIRTMQLLILIRNAYIDTDSDLPPWVQITLDRIAPFVRANQHADGTFAQFGGVSAEGGHGTNAILAASKAEGKATENSLHSGIQRAVAEKSCLIVDAGTPPALPYMQSCHASTAAFEFSVAQERFIINMGPAEPSTGLAVLTRTTAAHSTLVVADTNSSKVMDDGKLGAGVQEILTIRETLEDAVRIKVTHDGYEKRFGIKHERSLTMLDTGTSIHGEDRLFGSKLKKLAQQPLALRFHLHPKVEATKAPDGRITLMPRSGKAWIFELDSSTSSGVRDLSVDIEDSLYMKRPNKPEASRQIVVSCKAVENETPIILWHLSEMEL